jgi:hypothetical protein
VPYPSANFDVGGGNNGTAGTGQTSNIGNDFNNPYLSLGFYTNYLLQTEVMGTTWTRINSTIGTANAIIAPNGLALAERMTPNGTGARLRQTINNSETGNWTFSIYLKSPNGTMIIGLGIISDVLDGDERIINISNTWRRYTFTRDVNEAHSNITVVVNMYNATIDAWGGQLEKQNYAGIYGAARTTTNVTTPTSANILRGALTATGAITTAGAISATGAISSSAGLSGTTGGFSSTVTSTRATLFVSTDGLISTSTTAATLAAPIQQSPRLRFSGTVWDETAAASRTVNFKEEVIPISSITGSAKLVWGYGYNDVTDVGITQLMSLGSVGTLDVFGTTMGEEVLNNGNFTGLNSSVINTTWIINGGWQIGVTTQNMSRYQFSLGANGNLSQNSLNYSIPIKPNRWYTLSYNVSGTGVAGCVAFVDNVFSTEHVYLPGVSVTTAGQIFDVNIKTNSDPGNFTITARCTAGSFYLDTLSLKEKISGDIIANGQFTGGGTSGIKIDNIGNVGIGTITPTQTLDVNGSINISSTTGTLYVNGTRAAGIGTCTGTDVIQNISAAGVTCITPTGSTYTADNYTLTLSGTQFTLNTTYANTYFNDTARIDALNLSKLQNSSAANLSIIYTNNIIAGTSNSSFDTDVLFVDATNNRVGIGVATPNSTLQVMGNISQNDNYYHCFGDACDAYMYYNGTSLIIKVT